MGDCDEIMILGLADVSHMSIFNDFDETDRNEFHGRIIDQFSMLTVDSAQVDNHESTMGTNTNDLGNNTRAYTTLYSGQVEGVCGLFDNSIDTGNNHTKKGFPIQVQGTWDSAWQVQLIRLDKQCK